MAGREVGKKISIKLFPSKTDPTLVGIIIICNINILPAKRDFTIFLGVFFLIIKVFEKKKYIKLTRGKKQRQNNSCLVSN